MYIIKKEFKNGKLHITNGIYKFTASKKSNGSMSIVYRTKDGMDFFSSNDLNELATKANLIRIK